MSLFLNSFFFGWQNNGGGAIVRHGIVRITHCRSRCGSLISRRPKAVGTSLGLGGGGGVAAQFVLDIMLTLQRIQIVYNYIWDFKYPLSYELILAFLLYNELYIVIPILFNFFDWLNIGQLPPTPTPPVPTAIPSPIIVIVYDYLINSKAFRETNECTYK